MQIRSHQPSAIGNWFWCEPIGDRTNQAICRERIARQRPYSPCRDCQRFGQGAALSNQPPGDYSETKPG